MLELPQQQLDKRDLPPLESQEPHAASMPPPLSGVHSSANIDIYMSGLDVPGSSMTGEIEVPVSWAPYFGLKAKEKVADLKLSILRGKAIDSVGNRYNDESSTYDQIHLSIRAVSARSNA
jgi:hypothetical protein